MPGKFIATSFKNFRSQYLLSEICVCGAKFSKSYSGSVRFKLMGSLDMEYIRLRVILFLFLTLRTGDSVVCGIYFLLYVC